MRLILYVSEESRSEKEVWREEKLSISTPFRNKESNWKLFIDQNVRMWQWCDLHELNLYEVECILFKNLINNAELKGSCKYFIPRDYIVIRIKTIKLMNFRRDEPSLKSFLGFKS